MNKCIFVARLTRDPEVRYSTGETPTAIARFGGAVDRKIKTQDATADFLNFVAFGKQAEFVEKYCTKGIKLIIECRVQTGSFTNKEGQKVYTTDFVVESMEFAEKKNTDHVEIQQNNTSSQADSSFMNIPDSIGEELPFN